MALVYVLVGAVGMALAWGVRARVRLRLLTTHPEFHRGVGDGSLDRGGGRRWWPGEDAPRAYNLGYEKGVKG